MTKGKAAPAAAAAERGAPLSVTLDPETLAELDRLAGEFGATREHVVLTAVLRFVHEELRHLPPDSDNPFAKLPPYEDPTPEGKALSRAQTEAAAALDAFLKVGEDEADEGDLISQDEMEEWFARLVAERRRAAAAE